MVLPAPRRWDTRSPVTITAYGEAVVSATRKAALSPGRSLQGNHDGDPFGWLATSAPSVSSSHPTSPHRPEMGTGLPAYRMSTRNVSPAKMGRSGRMCSLSGRCVYFAGRPSTRMSWIRKWPRSRVNRDNGCTATAVTVARPASRLDTTR
nr:hypothetical protein GCM10020092_069220 [Actinoplanes digitatis]